MSRVPFWLVALLFALTVFVSARLVASDRRQRSYTAKREAAICAMANAPTSCPK